MQMRYGHHGWVRFISPADFPGALYMRVDEQDRVRELYLDAEGDEVSPAVIRSLPLGRLRARVLQRPDIRAAVRTDGNSAPAPRELLDQRFPDGGRPEHTGRPDPAVLHPPGPDGLTDDFLRTVAAAYTSAISRGERPNRSLAAQVGEGYSRRSVERWVYLARKRGLLSPTKRGEAR